MSIYSFLVNTLEDIYCKVNLTFWSSVSLTDFEYVFLYCVKIVFITWNSISIFEEDDPSDKNYGKHNLTKVTAMCNFSL